MHGFVEFFKLLLCGIWNFTLVIVDENLSVSLCLDYLRIAQELFSLSVEILTNCFCYLSKSVQFHPNKFNVIMVSFLNLIHNWFVIELEKFFGGVILFKDVLIQLLGLRRGSFGPLK